MKHVIESIHKYIPPENVGYVLVKRTKVFIPYKEFGINVLERSEIPLSFVHETVLKLLAEDVCNVEEMVNVLGLEYDILKEIIAEMAIADLVVVSEMSLILTAKGKIALQELKKVTVKKNQVNELYVNMITGEIESYSNCLYYDRPIPGYMYFDQTFDLDIQFLREKFSSVEKIYEKDKEEESIFVKKSRGETSLYRILDIAYQKIKYMSISCFVFVNEETASLLLMFDDDKLSVYSTIAKSQINNRTNSIKWLFESNREFIAKNKSIRHEIDVDKDKARNKLLSLIQQKSKLKVSSQEIESYYYSDRYLLDGEIADIIRECHEYKPQKLVIASPHMRQFLQDNLTSLINMLPLIKIILIYNKDEYGMDKSKEWLVSQLKNDNKGKQNIAFFPLDPGQKINTTQIICHPGFVINTLYELVEDDMNQFVLKEISDISFDLDKIMKALKQFEQIID
ncbi:hypothetical protein EV210_103356 [Anaerospora hongkongensis]|uniref:Uncharacterized protein n=1 Tax=Anaerospora hongkongensis TaxID=244830 RepID=A0A4R1Q4A0_9FIRM|nr:hypothetical protein [Anaerospora hongkongensis]TCL38872.1 hypothetical protein EV210_103356 [Anaerospora hongkongensis]